MRNAFSILSFLLLISCGKSSYYAYEDNASYSYCTIEVTKNKDIIYRATSSKYYQDYYHWNKFIYLSSLNDKLDPNIINDTINLNNPVLDIFYINDPIEFKRGLALNIYPTDLYISFIKSTKDTINTEYYLQNIKKEPSLQDAGLSWFPSYFIKTDKIDYTKFPKEIQHMNLKNPKKQK